MTQTPIPPPPPTLPHSAPKLTQVSRIGREGGTLHPSKGTEFCFPQKYEGRIRFFFYCLLFGWLVGKKKEVVKKIWHHKAAATAKMSLFQALNLWRIFFLKVKSCQKNFYAEYLGIRSGNKLSYYFIVLNISPFSTVDSKFIVELVFPLHFHSLLRLTDSLHLPLHELLRVPRVVRLQLAPLDRRRRAVLLSEVVQVDRRLQRFLVVSKKKKKKLGHALIKKSPKFTPLHFHITPLHTGLV